MSVKQGFWSEVDNEGRLRLSSETAVKYGLTPGAQVYLEPNGQGRGCTARSINWPKSISSRPAAAI
jgi:hypothetical protein